MAYSDRFLQVPCLLLFELDKDSGFKTEDGIMADSLIAETFYRFNVMHVDGYGPYNIQTPEAEGDLPFTIVALRSGKEFVTTMAPDDFEALMDAHFDRINKS
jgi:hypothetical protein